MLVPSSFSLDVMERAVGNVYERLLRATASLEQAGIPYAVADGHAVAAWVARVDESATRTTRDVDILIRRTDLEAVKSTLEKAGFHYRHSSGGDLFLDGAEAKARDAVHVVFAGEKVRAHEALANPDVTESELADRFRVLSLAALVRVKLTAFRDKDRVHLRDLLDVGLIDASWSARLPSELAARLQTLIDTPEG
ncbi:MAG: nucleotidyltransferase family protein [Gemmataceae bacterium]